MMPADTMQSAHYLARVAVHAAQAQLDACALATDDPHPCAVEAADLLQAAADCLARAATDDEGVRP